MPKTPGSPGLLRFFGRIGDHGWRESAYFTFSVRSAALRRWLAAQLPAQRLRILSVGCGSGELEHYLSEEGHDVVGIDVSAPMLRRARKRGLAALVKAESHALPFRAGSFDAVLFAESIGYLHLPTAFAEAARVLRTRGRLLITTYSGAVTRHAAYAEVGLADITAALATAGLRVAEHRFLAAKRTSVMVVPSNEGSTLLYVLSRRMPDKAKRSRKRSRG